ncbi:DUF429 domain-containing protein [Streptomyces auratus]|uniref:NUDIX hydrolase n=1 Tax=Streptomyces auratus AGR0001 TaxID=1160718 RepID=J2JSJ7_9ACTN
MVTVLGVDACPAGWLAVGLHDGRFADARVVSTLGCLLAGAAVDGVAVVAVDMPLGLLDAGWRRADTEAAALLGPRRGSVFRVPPRAVWQEEEYDDARRRCRELTGAGLSRQTWGLARKLREANACLAEPGGGRLFEVHPEVSFRALAGGTVLLPRKKSWAGQMAHGVRSSPRPASFSRTTWGTRGVPRRTTCWTRPLPRGRPTGLPAAVRAPSRIRPSAPRAGARWPSGTDLRSLV